MARARRKPHTPNEGIPKGDHGPNTLSQRLGARIEPVPDDANGMTRRIRGGVLEALHSAEDGIGMREYQAGVDIRQAFEATMQRPPAIREVFVDASPKPDATVAMQIDRQSEFARLMSAVPSDMRYVVKHVCCEDRAIRGLGSGREHGMHKARLQVALMLVANLQMY